MAFPYRFILLKMKRRNWIAYRTPNRMIYPIETKWYRVKHRSSLQFGSDRMVWLQPSQPRYRVFPLWNSMHITFIVYWVLRVLGTGLNSEKHIFSCYFIRNEHWALSTLFQFHLAVPDVCDSIFYSLLIFFHWFMRSNAAKKFWNTKNIPTYREKNENKQNSVEPNSKLCTYKFEGVIKN